MSFCPNIIGLAPRTTYHTCGFCEGPKTVTRNITGKSTDCEGITSIVSLSAVLLISSAVRNKRFSEPQGRQRRLDTNAYRYYLFVLVHPSSQCPQPPYIFPVVSFISCSHTSPNPTQHPLPPPITRIPPNLNLYTIHLAILFPSLCFCPKRCHSAPTFPFCHAARPSLLAPPRPVPPRPRPLRPRSGPPPSAYLFTITPFAIFVLRLQFSSRFLQY